jgi:hypothetical protein
MPDPKPLRPPAKILRVLGPKDDTAWERALVGIYDYLDSLATVAYQQAVAIAPVVNAVAPVVAAAQLRARDGIDGDDGDEAYSRPGAPGAPGSNGRRGGDGEDGEDGADGYSRAGSGGGITQLTGDGTAGPGSGSQVFTNVNAPDGFTLAGKVVATAIGGPVSPAAGKLNIWADAGNQNLFCKNPAGVVNHAVQTRAFSSNLFLASILDDGTVQVAQPDFSGITGRNTLAQLPQMTTGNRLLGSIAGGAQNVSEIALGSNLSISGSTLNAGYQWSATWGGYQYAIGGGFPLFVGVGPTSYSPSSGVFAFVAPRTSTGNDFALRIGANALTGTATTLNFKFYVNGVSVGTVFSVAYSATGSVVQAGGFTVNAGDTIEFQVSGAGGTTTGGDLAFHIIGAFR